jgi:glycosyltransferase involved in cell wall biosynthesis
MTSGNADITVVVTCFNYGQYLAEAVQSALAQDGGAPAVIVVDDGSTDPATHEALDALPPEVEVIRQANAGLSAARNAGLRRADTPYLIVLDADDRLPPGALAALREPLDAEPARAEQKRADALDGRLGFTFGRMRYFGDWEAEIPLPAYDPFKLLYRHTIGSTCLMRREVFDDVGGFDPAFPAFEDWDFWLSALERGWHGLQIPPITFEYRRHGGSMLTGARKHYRRLYRQLRRKHADLYARSGELTPQTDLGAAGRVVYRTFWAWRPVPARVEAAIYGVFFRRVRPAR